MYAVIAESFAVVPRVFNDLGAAFDHMVAQNRITGERVELRSRANGRLLRFREAVVQVDLSGIKLTDAMRKALDSQEDLIPARAATLKALETRGLAQKTDDGYRLTNLGRQYRAQKKGA